MEYRSESEGDKGKSFVVFEDDVDSVSSKSRQLEPATELDTTGKVPLVAGSKNVTVEICRTPNPQGTGEQLASRTPVQQGSKYHVLENFLAFRARNKCKLISAFYFAAHIVCMKHAGISFRMKPLWFNFRTIYS
jgi:hypothetical protein